MKGCETRVLHIQYKRGEMQGDGRTEGEGEGGERGEGEGEEEGERGARACGVLADVVNVCLTHHLAAQCETATEHR